MPRTDREAFEFYMRSTNPDTPLERNGEGYAHLFADETWEGFKAGVRAGRNPGRVPVPYILGNQYFTQAGDLVRFVAVHNEGTSYECMEDENGVNRYTKRDFGRVTGSAHDYTDPRNTPPLYTIQL